MNTASTQDSLPVVTKGPALALLEKDARWSQASESEKAVLRRIAAQRDRLAARKAAQQQARALKTQAVAVSPDAPLIERLMTFARLHPVASAGVLGLAMFLGPKRLMRTGMTVLPLLSKLRR